MAVPPHSTPLAPASHTAAPPPPSIAGQKRSRSYDDNLSGNRPSKAPCFGAYQVTSPSSPVSVDKINATTSSPSNRDNNTSHSLDALSADAKEVIAMMRDELHFIKTHHIHRGLFNRDPMGGLGAIHRVVDSVEYLWNQDKYVWNQDRRLNMDLKTQCERHKANCAELIDKLSKLEDGYNELKSKNEDMAIQVTSLQDEIAKYKTELDAAEEKAQSQKEELERTKQELEKTKGDGEKMKKELGNRIVECAMAKLKKDQVTGELKKMTEENQQLSDKIAWHESTIDRLEAENNQISPLKVEKDNLELELEQHKEEIARLKAEMDDQEKTLQGHPVTIDKFNQEKSDLKASNERFETQARQDKQTLRTHQAVTDRLKRDKSLLEFKVDAADQVNSEIKTQEEKNTIKIKALEEENTKLQRIVQEKTTALGIVSQQVEAVKTANYDLEQKGRGYMADVEKLKTNAKTQEQAFSDQKKLLESLLEQRRLENTQLESQKKDLEAEKATLKSQLEASLAKLEQLEDNLKSHKQNHKKALAEHKKRLTDEKRLEKQIQECQSKLKHSEAVTKALTEDKDRLHGLREELQAENTKLETELEEQMANYATLQKQLEEKTAELNEQTANYATLQKELEAEMMDLLDQIAQLEQENTKLQHRNAELEDSLSRTDRISRLVGFGHQPVEYRHQPSPPASDSHSMRVLPPTPNFESADLPNTSWSSLKPEAPDPIISRATTVDQGPGQLIPAVRPGDLQIGVIRLLREAFQMGTWTTGNHKLLIGFIERLGALESPDMPVLNAALNPLPFSGLKTLSLFTASSPSLLVKSPQEDFAHLCYLIDLLDDEREELGQYQAMVELITTIMNSDRLSDYPGPALAFLEAMWATRPIETPESYSPMKGLIAVMICELCRRLEHKMPWAPKKTWDIGTIMGDQVGEKSTKTPVGQLAIALARRSGDWADWPGSVVEQLSASCGDKFCHFDQGGEQMGFLCSDENTSFSIINFSKGELTVVDCAKADMDRRSRTECDLFVKLDGHSEEVLFKMENAPRKLKAFWMQYAMC
ncbi:hypothetical protein QBC38DRAFT_478749 [Podospora fimiseda]|uniref:Uncharacterized protein n=1 Tax=Podospora fimiseda TaxID=252190 RepID=A0AAN7BPA3_9PEZI|nr:hypothetical protein QBC38DRAFT_478749 [Podospora fimiseda]